MKNKKALLLILMYLISSCFGCAPSSNNPKDPNPKNPISEDVYNEKYITHLDSIPTIKINTEGNVSINSRVSYVDAQLEITNAGEYNLESTYINIRGRGNSSWGLDKKPYRIKFDKKISIFGYPAVKNWALIANHSDKTLLRNYMALALGRSLDTMDFNANVIPCEVELNGEYIGLYGLTDQMESGESRVDVEEYDIPADKSGVRTGFMVEIDARANEVVEGTQDLEGRDYFVYRIWDYIPDWQYDGNISLKFAMKYPKYDDKPYDGNPELYQLAFDYVKNYVTETCTAILTGNRTEFLNYCDEASFIDYFMVQELFQNTDAGYLSVFMNKTLDGKLKMGPLWDFDIAAGNTEYIANNYQNGLNDLWNSTRPYFQGIQTSAVTAGDYRYWYLRIINPFFSQLMKNPDFYSGFKERYNELYDHEIAYWLNAVKPAGMKLKTAAERNFEKWDILNNYIWPNPPSVIAADSYEKQIDYLYDFLKNRADWLYVNI